MNVPGAHFLGRIMVALVMAAVTTLDIAPAASAQIVLPVPVPPPLPAPFPAPVIGLDQEQPPQLCNEENDGAYVRWDGWLWECTFVLGDVPPWQWEAVDKL